MTKRHILFSIFFLVLVIFVPTTTAYAQTGASVTVPTKNVVSLIVDSAYSGSVEEGTSTKPYKTISAAIMQGDMLNAQAKHVRVRIKKGDGYREQVNINKQTNTNDKYTLTLEAFSPKEKPTLFGSERWMGDTFQTATPSGSNTVYSHAGGKPWGIQEDSWESWGFKMPLVMRRRENVSVGDQPLKQVLGKAELVPGTFYVEEDTGKTDAGTYYICPPVGTAMNAVTAFEIGKLPHIVLAKGRNNLLFKDLNIQNGSDYFEGAMRHEGCHNVRVENCNFTHNGGKGLVTLSGSDYSIANCQFYKNGIAGYTSGIMKNVVISKAKVTHNNWRGFNGEMTDWDSAGIKMVVSHNIKIQDSFVSSNYGQSSGIWFDSDIKNATIINTTSTKNTLGYGFFYEASQGPCLVKNCNFSENAIGLYSSAADYLTVEGCVIANNDSTPPGSTTQGYNEAQVLIFGHTIDDVQGRSFTDFETGDSPNPINYTTYGNHYTFKNNKIYWNKDKSEHALYGYRWNDQKAFQRFQSTLITAGNRYWHPSLSNTAFFLQDGKKGNLKDWQEVTGKDRDALWTPL
jgi:FlaG/FlaF family flagellin (archaellin)